MFNPHASFTFSERRFIEAYAKALQPDWRALLNAVNLYGADDFAPRCPFRAARMGRQLADDYAQFESSLIKAAARTDEAREKIQARFEIANGAVTAFALSSLAQWSFFKPVHGSDTHIARDAGWCSGTASMTENVHAAAVMLGFEPSTDLVTGPIDQTKGSAEDIYAAYEDADRDDDEEEDDE